jgi:hypothetical protein
MFAFTLFYQQSPKVWPVGQQQDNKEYGYSELRERRKRPFRAIRIMLSSSEKLSYYVKRMRLSCP